MDETREGPADTLPSLIVVTGRPGSGKTTLAHALARVLRCPAICRDEIKEGLLNTAGDAGGDVARGTYDAFFATVELLLRHRVTLVAEAAFQHQRWAPKLEPLRALAYVKIVLCDLGPELALSRHQARSLADPERAWFHDEPNLGDYDPPRLDVPTLKVDTSGGYEPNFETIVSFARS